MVPPQDSTDKRALADTHQRGALDITEFSIAMHLIQSLMSNHISAVPVSLTPELLAAASVGSPTGSQIPQAAVRRTNSVSSTGSGRGPQVPPKVSQSPIRQQFTGGSQTSPDGWDVTPQDKATFDALFRGIDTGNKGFIDGNCWVSLT
jgi:epidermal growth factor receptor substrate 15